jgi:hypothetical protein
MKGMALAKWAIFLERQLVGSLTFILGGGIIPVLATLTGQGNNLTHMKNFSLCQKYGTGSYKAGGGSM